MQNALYLKTVNEFEMLKETYVMNEELNSEISYNELEKCLRNLKTRKACGVDKIPNEVLKNDNLLPVLFYMFNIFFNNCKLPDIWLKATITPIYKGGNKDPLQPLSYRGISLLSCVCKLFSSVLNNRLKDFLENGNFYSDTQNGFRKNRSCRDHIYVFTSIIRNRLEQNASTYCCFIDMQKAFDYVNRELLFHNLLLKKIDGNLYNCIKMMYSHPVASIKLGNDLTDWFETESGVRQGDVLSPTLFGLFINDLANVVTELGLGIDLGTFKISILLYADDIVVIANTEDELQTILNCINDWCQKWRLKLTMTNLMLCTSETKE